MLPRIIIDCRVCYIYKPMPFDVILSNLPTWVTVDDIKAWLSADNFVVDSIKVVRNPETQESKGFAFIEAPNREQMNAIIKRFDRAPLQERLLRAAYASSGNEEDREASRREHIPAHVRRFVWRRDEGRCVECRSREKLEFDHIIPISRGGSNTERNIQLLCEECNRQKRAEV